jgi:hypothetical protein
MTRTSRPSAGASHVYLFAFGYFACYVPYSALTKALTSGRLGEPHDGLELLPLATLASSLSMFVVISLLGWWRYATRVEIAGRSLPRPGLFTTLSGLTTAAILVTTTLAYTFESVSIPLVMLLMRGGVLVLAPVVDRLTARKVRWFSYAALGVSALALVVAFAAAGASDIPFWCGVDIAVYLASYFVRLQLMSRLAKSDDVATGRRYFVEEQMVAAPAALLALAALALVSTGSAGSAIAQGFTAVWDSPDLWALVLVGVLSQGTGVFGGLVLLDARESSFCVPLNRASSVLAGVGAGLVLTLFGDDAPSWPELAGAALLVGAIVVLWVGPRIDARRAGKDGAPSSRPA